MVQRQRETSPKGFSASKCDVGNWIFSKSKDFFEKLLGNFLYFLEGIFGEIFWRIFWEEFFGRIFREEFFRRNFLGEICWEDFFGRIFLRGILWEEFFVYIRIDLFVKTLVFVKILGY